MDKYLKQCELAEALSVTTTTIKRWLKKGLPYHNLAGNKRYLLEECVEWLKKN